MTNQELMEEKMKTQSDEILEENIEEVLEAAELKNFGITLPRDSQGYEFESQTEANSKESAARIFKARLPKNYEDREAEDLLDYISKI